MGLAQSPCKPAVPRACLRCTAASASQTFRGYSAQVWDEDSGVRTGNLSKVTFQPYPARAGNQTVQAKNSLLFFFFKWKNICHMCMCISEVFILFGLGLECSTEGSVSPDLRSPQPMSLFMSFPFIHFILNYSCCRFRINLL